MTLSKFVTSVAPSTIANLVGRAANVLVPLTVVGLYGANPHTDQFFFILALSYYFYGTLSYAAIEPSVPIIISSNQALSSIGIVGIGLFSALVLFSISWFWLFLTPGMNSGYAFGFALMSGAGLANGFATGILNARERFMMPGLSWSLRIIPIVIFVLFNQPAQNLHFLAIGIGIIDWLRLWLLLSHQPDLAIPCQKYSPLLFLKNHSSKYLPTAMAMIIMGLNPIIDRFIADFGGPGSISILDTGERLFGIFSVLCTLGMMTVLLTNFSKAVINKTIDKTWSSMMKMVGLWSTAWLAIAFLIGYSALEIWLSKSATLSPDQGLAIQKTYAYYLLGLIPLTFSIVYFKRLQAIQSTWPLAITSIITVLINIPASFVLHQMMGVPGIALATAIIYAAQSAMLILIVHRPKSIKQLYR